MTDRRRFPRYVFLVPVEGRARTMCDCVVEQIDGDRGVLLTTHPAVLGEDFVIQLDSPGEAPTSYTVRVESCTPRPTDGATQYSLQVTLSPVSPSWNSTPVLNI